MKFTTFIALSLAVEAFALTLPSLERRAPPGSSGWLAKLTGSRGKEEESMSEMSLMANENRGLIKHASGRLDPDVHLDYFGKNGRQISSDSVPLSKSAVGGWTTSGLVDLGTSHARLPKESGSKMTFHWSESWSRLRGQDPSSQKAPLFLQPFARNLV